MKELRKAFVDITREPEDREDAPASDDDETVTLRFPAPRLRLLIPPATMMTAATMAPPTMMMPPTTMVPPTTITPVTTAWT